MKRQMFEELLGSVREAGTILRGQKQPSRRIVVPSSGRPDHSRTNQPFAVGVRAFDRRKCENASELGTASATPHRTRSRTLEHH